MNILLWAPHGAGEHYWGPGISAYRLYNLGLQRRINLFLAHGCCHQGSYPELFDYVYFISGLSAGGNKYIEQLKFLIHSYSWIKAYHKKFDVVHVLGAYETSFRPALWFEKFGVPCFVKITGEKGGISGNSFLSRLLGISKNRLKKINHLSGYIAISDQIQTNLLRSGVNPEKIYKIPNGVNTDVFKPANNDHKVRLRKKLNIKDKFTVLFVGGISAGKQPLMLVEAIKDVISQIGEKVQLLLVGPDRDNKTLDTIKLYITENGLETSVFHIKYTDKPEIYYQIADLYCLPSKSEGMSNALLEALSSGLPSIVTPVSGSLDLIDKNNCGLIIKNEKDLIDAIHFYFDNQSIAKQHGENGRKMILKNFDSREVLDKHLEIFTKAYNSTLSN